ncbi:MAG TPA: hypothetical protein VGJ66_15565 [Pyrinomonadaceae bacterium]
MASSRFAPAFTGILICRKSIGNDCTYVYRHQIERQQKLIEAQQE